MSRDFGEGATPTPQLSQGQGIEVVVSGGRSERVDPRTLLDSEGGRYVQVADVWADEGDEAARATLALWRDEGEAFSADAADAQFLRTHPGGDLAAYHAALEGLHTPYAPPLRLGAELTAWLATAAAGARREVHIQLRDRPSMALPPLHFDPLAVGPSFDPAGQAARGAARAAYRAEGERVLDAFEAEVGPLGVTLAHRRPMRHAMTAWVDTQSLEALLERSDVLGIHPVAEGFEAFANGGSAIHHATQVGLALSEGYDGSVPTGKVPGASAVRLLVMDGRFDQDHPVWAQRLHSWFQWGNGGFEEKLPGDLSQTTAGGAHGSGVLTQAAANGYQHIGSSGAPWASTAKDRSGTAPNVELVFVDREDGGSTADLLFSIPDDIEYPDVYTSSLGEGGPKCTSDDGTGALLPAIDNINSLYLEDVVVVLPAGNDGTAPPLPDAGTCIVQQLAMAAGALTVGGTQHADVPLRSADLSAISSFGGDVHGRAVVDLVAPDGREIATADFDDWYLDGDGSGTSYSAPIVAGAAVDTQQMMMSFFSSSFANRAGNVMAALLLFGDDTRYVPPTLPGDPARYVEASSAAPQAGPGMGLGRLNMRTFGTAGMDAPHRVRQAQFTLMHHHQQVVLANPDQGVNQPLPADVDRLEAVVWWYEPNLACAPGDQGCASPADLDVELCNSTTCYSSNSTAPEPQRVIAPDPGGETWEVRVFASKAPVSSDPDYLYGQTARTVHVALMWEDRDRDDVEGPYCTDEIDLSCDACCAQAGATCAPDACDP